MKPPTEGKYEGVVGIRELARPMTPLLCACREERGEIEQIHLLLGPASISDHGTLILNPAKTWWMRQRSRQDQIAAGGLKGQDRELRKPPRK
jgi:hypothetical protein